MKAILAVSIVAALMAAAGWAPVGSQTARPGYRVEVNDVAGTARLVVAPEVVAAVPGHYTVLEVVVTSNMMPEVVVHARPALSVAAAQRPGVELVN